MENTDISCSYINYWIKRMVIYFVIVNDIIVIILCRTCGKLDDRFCIIPKLFKEGNCLCYISLSGSSGKTD